MSIDSLIKDARAWAAIGATPDGLVSDKARKWYASHPLAQASTGLSMFGDGGLDIRALEAWLRSGGHPMPKKEDES